MDLEAAWYEDDSWRGYLLIEPIHSLLDRHVFVTWLAGFEHYADGQDESFNPGSPLALVPEPDNPHDPAAVGVWNGDRTLMAGHLPHVIVRELTVAHREGLVMWEQRAGGLRVGVGVLVSREQVTLKLVTITVADAVRRVRRMPHTKGHIPTASFDPVAQMEQMALALRKLKAARRGGPGD